MPVDRELMRQIRELDEFDLRRLMIFVRGLLVSREGGTPGRELEGRAGKVSYRQERVRCGRANCTRCPHGPYWYAYWREDGRLRSRYIGKELPAGIPPPTPTPEGGGPRPRD
jgi:hypothetical protein